MAAGRVITGFSKPYVAKFSESPASSVIQVTTYNDGQLLARGVSVSIDPESGDDNGFYGDNGLAETEKQRFTGGTVTLTVDGLFADAERLIMGLPAASSGWILYNDDQNVPLVGVGFIIRYQSGGTVTYVPVILVKCRFTQIPTSAATQEENVDYQTQELTAKILKTNGGKWKRVGPDYASEDQAEAVIRTYFSILAED